MLRCFLALFYLSFSCHGFAKASKESGEFDPAQSWLSYVETHFLPSFEKIRADLDLINEPLIMPHEVKSLRKDSVARLKRFLQVVGPLFPASKRLDPWWDLVQSIDACYGILGAFRDLLELAEVKKTTGPNGEEILTYVYHDLTELRKRRTALKKWHQGFVKHYSEKKSGELKEFFKDYFSRPQDTLQRRPSEQLSRFFWRDFHRFPLPSASAHTWMSVLARHLLGKSLPQID